MKMQLSRISLAAALVGLMLLPALAAARQQPTTDVLASAADHLNNMEYDAALGLLRPWLAAHPDDLRALNLLAATRLRQEMFRQGLLEVTAYGDESDVYKPGKVTVPPDLEKELETTLGHVAALTEERLKRDSKDADALYWAGVAQSTQAMFALTLQRSYLAALKHTKNASSLHKQLLAMEPDNADAMLVVGMHNYVLGSLPWYVKIMASLTGNRGDKKLGVDLLRRCAEQGHWSRADARFVLPVVYMREHRTGDALAVLQGLAADYPRNFLLPQEIASVYRVERNWSAALETYESVLARHKAGAPGFAHMPTGRVLYLAGKTAAQMGEREQALQFYEQGAQLDGGDPYTQRSQAAATELRKRMAQPAAGR